MSFLKNDSYHLALFALIALSFGFYSINIYGLTFYIGFVLFVPLFFMHWHSDFEKIKAIKISLVWISLFLIAHTLLSIFVVNSSIFNEYDPNSTYLIKILLSIPIFLSLFFTGYSISKTKFFDELSWRHLSRWLYIFAIISTFINIMQFFLVQALELKSSYFNQNLFYGFFGEPSFFGKAMILMISTLYFLDYESKKKIVIIWLVSWISSMTLTYTALSLVLLSLIFFKEDLRYKFVYSVLIPFIFISILLIFSDIQLYFYKRLHSLFNAFSYAYYGIDLEAKYDTITHYYVAAIFDVINSLKLTWGLGSGFNSMGLLPRDPDISKIFYTSWSNKTDGSFLFAKMTYEFGIFAISAYLYLAFKSMFTFLKSKNTIQMTAAAIVIMALAIFMTRSCVYFLELYFIMALPYLFIKANNNNLNLKISKKP